MKCSSWQGGLFAVRWGEALLKTFSSDYLHPGFQVELAFLAKNTLGAVSGMGMAAV